MPKKLLIVDNYDSFTYNLYQHLREISLTEPLVVRNDKVDLDGITEFDGVVLSPGPGIPSEAGLMPDLLAHVANRIPILGICLGHQAIAEHFGGTLVNMSSVCHGLSLNTRQLADDPIYSGVPKEFPSGRYHSWVVDADGLPTCLQITSSDDDGRVMSLRHKEFNVVGLQYHPESVLTPDGQTILRNWMETL